MLDILCNCTSGKFLHLQVSVITLPRLCLSVRPTSRSFVRSFLPSVSLSFNFFSVHVVLWEEGGGGDAVEGGGGMSACTLNRHNVIHLFIKRNQTATNHPNTCFIFFKISFNFIQIVCNKNKQNRESTEGYSKSIVRRNNKFGKRIGLNK